MTEESGGPVSRAAADPDQLTADLPDADPGRVAAAALRGRSASADAAELREPGHSRRRPGLISEDRPTPGSPPGC
ncbi:hypothetical protein GCM10023238_20820 [Streptomyces heliomycini]